MENNAFQRLWWKFSDVGGPAKKKEVLRTACALYVFTVAQVAVLVNHFEYPSDKLEALEILFMRIVDLTKNRENLLTAFNHQLRDYARIMLNEKLMDALPGDRYEPLLVRQFASRSLADMRVLKKSVKRSYYTTNDWEALGSILHSSRTGFNYDQLYKLFVNCRSDQAKFLEVVAPLSLGVTVREASRLLSEIPPQKRIDVLPAVLSMVLDPENKWILIDTSFQACGKDHIDRAKDVIREAAPYPRSPVVGTITTHRVVFLVDVSTSMECPFETNQGEIIRRIRFIARDLSRTIKEQLQPTSMFNIVAFGRGATRCFSAGMRVATPENLERASIFLRLLTADGPTNTLSAFVEAFDEEELDSIYLITDGKPSFSHSYAVRGDDEVALQVPDVLRLVERLRHSRGPSEQVPVHCTAVLMGVHPSDDVEGTLQFCKQLAEQTGGLYRCLVHKRFVLFIAKEGKKKGTVESKPRQFVRRGWRGILYQSAIFFSWAFMMAMMMLSREVPFGGQTSGEVSAKYPTFLTAHPNCWLWYRLFAVWSAITVMKLTIPTMTSDGLIRCFRFFWPGYCLCTALYPLAFQNEAFLVSVVLAAGMLGFSILLYKAVEVGRRTDSTVDEMVWVHLPLGSMVAWSSYMFMLTIAVYMKWWEWYGWGWQWEWAVMLMFVLALLSVALLVQRREVAFPITVVWVLANVTRSHWGSVYERQENEAGVETYTYAFWMCLIGISLSVVLSFLTALTIALRISTAITRDSTVGQKKKNLTFIRLQTSNAVTFFIALIINALSARWGYRAAGMSSAPLNRETCGSIAFEAGTIHIMPAKFAFKIWPVIYVLLLPFVFTQMLPTETTLPGWHELDKRDSDLGKRVFIRGTRRRRLVIALCGKCRFSIPLVHEWRLTRRAQEVVQSRISGLFCLANLLNVLYLVCWTFREHAWALILLLALLVTVGATYTRVGAFRTVLSEHEQTVLRKPDEEVEMALRTLRGGKGNDGSSGRGKGDLDDEKEAKGYGIDEDAEEDADDGDGDAAAAAAGKDGKGKGKGGVLSEPVSSWERWAVHVPFSLYMGWLSYCLALQIAFLGVRDGWGGLGLTASAWAVITMTLLTLISLAVLVKRKDAVFPLAIIVALFGIAYDNTIGTCPGNWENSMAGKQLRSEGLMIHWNVTSAADCTMTGYTFNTGKCRLTDASIDSPITCERLGTRVGGFRKGYNWIDGSCVEDVGVCPYQPAKGLVDSHRPEYVVATTAIFLLCLLSLATLGIGGLAIKARRGRKKAVQSMWKSMMEA